jgi:hypothetical protein
LGGDGGRAEEDEEKEEEEEEKGWMDGWMRDGGGAPRV